MIQCHVRIIDVRLIQINLVMHNLTARSAAFAKTVNLDDVTRPAFLPRLTAVEVLSEFTHR